MKLNIPKVLFSNGKKKTASLTSFSATLLVLQVRGGVIPINRNLFTPPVNIPIRLLKARGSRDLDKYRASDTHFRALQMVTHTHTHPLTKLDRFPVPPNTIKRTSSILRQFCVCVAHSTNRIAVFVSLIPQVVSLISLKVRTSRWKHFNFPSSIYLDEFFKSRSRFEIAICLISSKYLLWFQAPAEEYLINVHENLCLIIFYDHRCQHFSSDPKEESVFWNF